MKRLIGGLLTSCCLMMAVGCTEIPVDDSNKTETENQVTDTKKEETKTPDKKDEQTAEDSNDPNDINPNGLKQVDQLAPPVKGDQVAIIKTNMGDIRIKLFGEQAPKTVKNFVDLAEQGYYNTAGDNKMIFHRVINDFMIQGGDPTGTGTGGQSSYGKEFEDEPARYLSPVRGALAMANRGRNTNGSQFFIVHGPQVPTDQGKLVEYKDQLSQIRQGFDDAVKNSTQDIPEIFTMPAEVMDNYEKLGGSYWLDYRLSLVLNPQQPAMHTVFGQVYEGMDVVDKISGVKVGANDKPEQDVIIESITIEEYK